MQPRENKDYFGPDSRDVIELTPNDFNEKAPWILKPRSSTEMRTSSSANPGKTEPITGMVLFYAPWCPHCKEIQTPWIDAARVAGFCDFYAFNCEKNKKHVEKIKADMPELIRGYPTIVIYVNGKPDEYYQGERTKSAFVETCMRICEKCKTPKPAPKNKNWKNSNNASSVYKTKSENRLLGYA